VPVGAAAVAAAMLGLAAWLVDRTTYNLWATVWLGPTLMLLAVPIARHATRADGDRRIGRIVLAAAFIKVFVTPLARYWMAFGLYDGSSDSARYHNAGKALASQLRQLDYSGLGDVTGTRFVEVLAAQLYALTGPTRLGGFMVFSWMAFVGLYLFYRAFRTAYPDGDHRRYALLVFFYPSLIFWPSSIGKESFALLVLGAATLGGAQLLSGHFRGMIWLGLGLWGAAVVRPHMALIVTAGLLVAAPLAVLRGAPARERPRGRFSSAALVVGLLVAASALVGVAQEFFDLEDVNTESTQQLLDETTRRSGKSGSTFTGNDPSNPVGFVLATGTVLLRPFPFEVGNVQAQVTALEGVLLLVLFAVSARRIVRLPVELIRRPYLAFAFVYVVAFVYAFASLANFGILARQRVQVLPVLFILLCIRPGARGAADAGGGGAAQDGTELDATSEAAAPSLVEHRARTHR
jgi:hypothetical protein